MVSFYMATVYFLSVNFISLTLFGIDKYKAKHKKRRTPESTLLLLAIIGGSVGAWMGMKLFHHKTLHKKFYIGIPAIIIIQVALLIFIHFYITRPNP